MKFAVSNEFPTLREGTAISNIDGRLWGEVGSDTGRYFGDEAMVRARIGIEARYLIALSQVGVIRKFTSVEKEILLQLHDKITPNVYDELRQVESSIRHDVMAMTTMMRKLLSDSDSSLIDVIDYGWIHWGLTSEDVDNLARTSLLQSYIREIFLPQLGQLLEEIVNLAEKTIDLVIPGKTHLQTALPTLLGKEIALYGVRLGEQAQEVGDLTLRGKLTGAVGSLAAHKAALPKIDWLKFSSNFVKSLGLEPNLFTTQIESRSRLVELLDKARLINGILIDLYQDMSLIIGLEWLVQEVKKQEFGSSAMPQKVNPIDFENAQGNVLFSNWILEGLARQLPISWLQRDLVDKTILRNLGLPFGHSLIAFQSTIKGLRRVNPNPTKINEELDKDWSAITEGFQIYLRSIGQGDAYDTLKELSRGKQIGKADVSKWIDGLKLSQVHKHNLQNITPASYIGYAKELTVAMIKKTKMLVKGL